MYVYVQQVVSAVTMETTRIQQYFYIAYSVLRAVETRIKTAT